MGERIKNLKTGREDLNWKKGFKLPAYAFVNLYNRNSEDRRE